MKFRGRELLQSFAYLVAGSRTADSGSRRIVARNKCVEGSTTLDAIQGPYEVLLFVRVQSDKAVFGAELNARRVTGCPVLKHLSTVEKLGAEIE